MEEQSDSNIVLFSDKNEELEFYKSSYKSNKAELYTCKNMIKNLETANYKLKEMVIKNIIPTPQKCNTPNASRGCYSQKEFKQLYESIIQIDLIESFDFCLKQYILISNLSKDIIFSVYEETQKVIDLKFNDILKCLNLDNTPKNKHSEIFAQMLPFFRENLHKIFKINDNIIENIHEKILKIVNQYDFKKNVNIIEEENENLDNIKDIIENKIKTKNFDILIKGFFNICIYMILHEPILTFDIQKYTTNRKNMFYFFNQNEFINVEGFGNNKTPCILLVPPPSIKSKYPFFGLKPAVYTISDASESIFKECELNKNDNNNKNILIDEENKADSKKKIKENVNNNNKQFYKKITNEKLIKHKTTTNLDNTTKNHIKNIEIFTKINPNNKIIASKIEKKQKSIERNSNTNPNNIINSNPPNNHHIKTNLCNVEKNITSCTFQNIKVNKNNNDIHNSVISKTKAISNDSKRQNMIAQKKYNSNHKTIESNSLINTTLNYDVINNKNSAQVKAKSNNQMKIDIDKNDIFRIFSGRINNNNKNNINNPLNSNQVLLSKNNTFSNQKNNSNIISPVINKLHQISTEQKKINSISNRKNETKIPKNTNFQTKNNHNMIFINASKDGISNNSLRKNLVDNGYYNKESNNIKCNQTLKNNERQKFTNSKFFESSSKDAVQNNNKLINEKDQKLIYKLNTNFKKSKKSQNYLTNDEKNNKTSYYEKDKDYTRRFPSNMFNCDNVMNKFNTNQYLFKIDNNSENNIPVSSVLNSECQQLNVINNYSSSFSGKDEAVKMKVPNSFRKNVSKNNIYNIEFMKSSDFKGLYENNNNNAIINSNNLERLSAGNNNIIINANNSNININSISCHNMDVQNENMKFKNYFEFNKNKIENTPKKRFTQINRYDTGNELKNKYNVINYLDLGNKGFDNSKPGFDNYETETKILSSKTKSSSIKKKNYNINYNRYNYENNIAQSDINYLQNKKRDKLKKDKEIPDKNISKKNFNEKKENNNENKYINTAHREDGDNNCRTRGGVNFSFTNFDINEVDFQKFKKRFNLCY